MYISSLEPVDPLVARKEMLSCRMPSASVSPISVDIHTGRYQPITWSYSPAVLVGTWAVINRLNSVLSFQRSKLATLSSCLYGVNDPLTVRLATRLEDRPVLEHVGDTNPREFSNEIETSETSIAVPSRYTQALKITAG